MNQIQTLEQFYQFLIKLAFEKNQNLKEIDNKMMPKNLNQNKMFQIVLPVKEYLQPKVPAHEGLPDNYNPYD